MYNNTKIFSKIKKNIKNHDVYENKMSKSQLFQKLYKVMTNFDFF